MLNIGEIKPRMCAKFIGEYFSRQAIKLLRHFSKAKLLAKAQPIERKLLKKNQIEFSLS
jgi:hypothetical protein